MRGPFVFLFGHRQLRVSLGDAGEVMNLCHMHGFVYREFAFCGEYACFSCRPRVARRLCDACRARGIAVVEEPIRGLPGLLGRYRHRYGIFLGALLFTAIVLLSGQVVWDIRIEGNERLDDGEVLAALHEQGFHVGSIRRRLDIDALENRVLLYSDDISWMSVNIIGTVASVEIREVEPIPTPPVEYAAANLVAARGGVVEWFEDVRGNVAVEIGEAVGEGDLLVGGLYGEEGKTARYTCAKGKVLARTAHRFSVEIPMSYEKKTYTGRVWVEKYLIFFEKEVKFFANSGNSPMTCDTIEMIEYFQTHGGSSLPVGVRTVRHYEYVLTDTERSEEAAVEVAYDTLRYRMEAELSDGAMLVRKRTHGERTESAYVLHAYVECIENIAKTEEIKIEGISDGVRE